MVNKTYANVCLDIEVNREVLRRCRAEGRSRSSLIENLLRQWLAMKESPPEIESKDPIIVDYLRKFGK